MTATGRHIPRGFTLIELLVTLAVAAVLLSLAVPFGSRLVQSAQVRGATAQMQSYLLRARSEAITRQVPVTLCPTVDGLTCSGSDNYQTGILVFADNDLSGDFGSGDDLVIQRQPWASAAQVSAVGSAEITFSAHGFALTTLAVPILSLNGHIEPRRVCVQRSGRIETVSGEAVCPHES